MDSHNNDYCASVRVLPVFVSSTFKDMHRERDCIASLIAPELNAKLRPYGAMIRFIDLRWGIITSKDDDAAAREESILKVCFDEILRSKPLFVGLLGSRYGWVPSMNRRKGIASNVKKQFPEYDISVTEMEIRFGALNQTQVNKHAIFCFRDDYVRGEQIDYRLQKLHDDIRQSIDVDRCIDYHLNLDDDSDTDLENFRRLLTNAMWREACEILNIDNGVICNTENIVAADLSVESHSHTSVFFGRDEDSRTLLEYLKHSESIALSGPAGCGKSALLNNIYSELSSNKDYLPIYYNATCTSQTKSPTTMLNYFCACIADALGEGHNPEEFHTDVEYILGGYAVVEQSLIRLEKNISGLFGKLQGKGKQLLFIVDNIDCLQTDRYRDKLLFLPDGAAALVSLKDANLNPPFPTERYTIDNLSYDDALGMLNRRFAFHDKQLHSSVAQSAVLKSIDNTSHHNPLWLATMAHYLIYFDAEDFKAMLDIKAVDEEDRIEAYCLHMVDEAPADTIQLMLYVVDRAKRTFGNEVVDRGMALLCLGRQGFRDMDFSNIFGKEWDALHFAEFCRWMRPFISESLYSHQWMITHPYMASAWKQQMGKENCRQLHGAIANMLFAYPTNDPLRWQEAFYHAYKGHLWHHCARLIADLGNKSALPVQMLFRQMDTKQLMNCVKDIVGNADNDERPEAVGKLFQVAIHDWAVEHPIESAELCLQCFVNIDFTTLTEDYQFICLESPLKDRLLYAKVARNWPLTEQLAKLLYLLSEQREMLTPGNGVVGKSIASMELFNSLTAQGRINEANRAIRHLGRSTNSHRIIHQLKTIFTNKKK